MVFVAVAVQNRDRQLIFADIVRVFAPLICADYPEISPEYSI